MIEMLKYKPRFLYVIRRYLGIWDRSVYRYIESIKESGLIVYKDKFGRYGIERNNS